MQVAWQDSPESNCSTVLPFRSLISISQCHVLQGCWMPDGLQQAFRLLNMWLWVYACRASGGVDSIRAGQGH